MLPISPTGQVLLLHCVNPGVPAEPYWMTVGGGIEAGEDERAAAVRELWEETAMVLAPAALVGPLHDEVVEFCWAEYDIVQHQSYWLAAVTDTTVSFDHLEQIEVDTTLGYRWWTLEELRTTTERLLPNQVAVIESALHGFARGGIAYFDHGLLGQ